MVQSVHAAAPATVYTQSFGSAGQIDSHAVNNAAGSDGDVFTFAAFTPTQSGTVDNIAWQGSSNTLYPGFSDGFTVEVTSGQPATPDTLLSGTVLTKVVATGAQGAAHATPATNSGIYDYNLDVPAFAVEAGKTYYISIRSNGLAPWGWSAGSGTNAIAFYVGLAKWLRTSGAPAFSLNNLYGSSVAPIATPVNPNNLTILPVPAPVPTAVVGEIGQVQGMITAVGTGYVMIDDTVVTHDGDTVKTFNGGLTTLAVGEMVNYTYIVDVDGVVIAKTMDIYPAEAVSGVDRVSSISVNNATGVVSLPLYKGGAVDFYQHAGIYVSGAGTNTSYGSQLVNYTGFINPTTGHIVASVSGYMSNIPVFFKPVLPAGTVGQAYNQYVIDYSLFGMANIYSLSAVGLPAGLTNNMGSITGTPTTPGTYNVVFTAVGGQWNVSPYIVIGKATTTIVVNPDLTVVVSPPADTVAPVITKNGTDATLTVGDVYTDAGATCTDNVDPTCTVVTTGSVDTTTAGTYTLTYNATDVAGNTATPVVRTVTVNAPVVVPVPVCSGTDVVITNAANPRAAILEVAGGPANGGIAIQIFQSSTTILPPLTTATFFKAGNLITYTGTMSANNLCVATSATISAPLPPPDVTAPVITVIGGNVTQTVGTTYTDAGATCADNVDPTCTVVTTSTVNTGVVGTYTVTYNATDAAGNTAAPVVRTVTVNPVPDTIAPVITQNGSNVSQIVGTTYTDAGATCTDNVDPTCTVVTTSTVNTAIAGTYTVTYGATDAAGNVATAVVRTVTITSPVTPPTTSYTSTGVKVDTKGVLAAYNATSKTVTLTTGLVLRLTSSTKVIVNDGATLASVGKKVQYKGVKNTDNSVTLTQIEVN
jgi:hypothetical protein